MKSPKSMESQVNDGIKNESKSNSSRESLSSWQISHSKNSDNNLRVFGTAAQKPLPTGLNEKGKTVDVETNQTKLRKDVDVQDTDCSEMTQATEHWLSSRKGGSPMTTFDDLPERKNQRTNSSIKFGAAHHTSEPLRRLQKKETNHKDSRESSKEPRRLNLPLVINSRIDSKRIESNSRCSLPLSTRSAGTTCETCKRRMAEERPTSELLKFCDDEEREVPSLPKTMDDNQSLFFEDKPAEEITLPVSSIHRLAPFRRQRDLEVYNDPIMRGLESLKELIHNKQEEYRRRYTKELDHLQKCNGQLTTSLSYI